jgi:hypothetical protein
MGAGISPYIASCRCQESSSQKLVQNTNRVASSSSFKSFCSVALEEECTGGLLVTTFGFSLVFSRRIQYCCRPRQWIVCAAMNNRKRPKLSISPRACIKKSTQSSLPCFTTVTNLIQWKSTIRVWNSWGLRMKLH